jgi:hypothetical protein
VGDPDVSLEILQLIILGGLFGIAHDLQDQHIPPVGKDECLLLAEGSVKFLVQLKAVPEDKLVFRLSGVHSTETILGRKILQDLFLHPNEIPIHIRRLHFQPFHLAVITDRRGPPGIVDLEKGLDEGGFHRGANFSVQEGDLEQVIFFQHFSGNSQALR